MSPTARETGSSAPLSPIPYLTAFKPASVPVTIASVCPTNKPAFSPPTNKLSIPITFIVLSLGAIERYLIEFAFPPE